MNVVSLLLAWRYLRNTHTEQSISMMAQLCFIGVFIGTFALALVLSIMQGFEHLTHEKFRGIHAPLTIRAYGDALNVDALIPVLEKEFPEIAAYSPSDTQQVIMQSDDANNRFTIVALKGVIPQREADLNGISKKFVNSHNNNFVTALANHRIILGKKLAQELHVTIGDPLTILYARPEQTHKNHLTLDHATAYVGGIFDAGIDEVDSSLALCSFEFLQSLFADAEFTQIGLQLHAGTSEQQIVARLKERLGLEIFSWKDLYPALVEALKLEKYGMFLILALITLVASMNIISLLFMQITHKRGDIAILKAMGMADRTIKTIFILMGTGISIVGSLMGLIASGIVGYFLKRYPIIQLPDVYYISHLPIEMSWSIFFLVAVVTILLGFVATWIPIRRITNITIAKVLRMEA